MNVIFTAVFIASAALCIIRPDSFLPALIEGAGRAVTSFASLFCVYALWMGLSKVCEDANITAWLANKLAPLTGRIFRTKNKSGKPKPQNQTGKNRAA